MTRDEPSGHTRSVVREWCGVVLLLALALASCRSPSSPTATSGPFTIRGALTDFATARPTAGARLAFSREDGSSAGDVMTDAAGRYTLGLNGDGTPMRLSVAVEGTRTGDVVIGDANWRGDLMRDTVGCVSRYGLVVDAGTGQGVAGAQVTVGGTSMTSAADGWYRIDLGCPPGGIIGFNTSFAEVTHPRYATLQRVVGRGIARVERLDLALSGP